MPSDCPTCFGEIEYCGNCNRAESMCECGAYVERTCVMCEMDEDAHAGWESHEFGDK